MLYHLFSGMSLSLWWSGLFVELKVWKYWFWFLQKCWNPWSDFQKCCNIILALFTTVWVFAIIKKSWIFNLCSVFCPLGFSKRFELCSLEDKFSFLCGQRFGEEEIIKISWWRRTKSVTICKSGSARKSHQQVHFWTNGKLKFFDV